LGRGTVIEVHEIGSKREARIDFGYTRVWRPLTELEQVAAAPISSAPAAGSPAPMVVEARKPAPLPRPALTGPRVVIPDCDQVTARNSITALRLGQVMESDVEHLSVGLDGIVGTLKAAVQATLGGDPRAMLVEGSWGAGKTHALTLLQALALRKGICTARVILDGISISLAEPTTLLEAALNSLRMGTERSSDGSLDLLRRAMSKAHRSELSSRGVSILSKVLDCLPDGTLDDPEISQVIEEYFCLAIPSGAANLKLRSRGIRTAPLPILRPTRLVERPRAVATLLAEWARFVSVLGYRGLLLVIDELDVDFAAALSRTAAARAKMDRRTLLIQELANLGNDSRSLPLLVAFASAPAEGDIPAEMDPGEILREAYEDRLIYVQVPAPSDHQMTELLGKLASRYVAAYPDAKAALGERQLRDLAVGLGKRHRRLTNPVPRSYVRMALEVFDVISAGGQQPASVLAALESGR
jgi:hypothetical protein